MKLWRHYTSSPAVMAAVGAMGHVLVAIHDDNERRAKMTEIVERLTLINWTKGDLWAGIAGKYTPKGNFSLGGTKENAYAVYAALTDVTTDGYKSVRSTSPVVLQVA